MKTNAKIAQKVIPVYRNQKIIQPAKLPAILWCICVIIIFSAGKVSAQTTGKSSIKALHDPLLVMQVPIAPTPVPIMSSKQLLYELHISNRSKESLILDQLKIFNANDETLIELFDDSTLSNRIYQFDTSSGNALSIAPGKRAVVYLEITPDGEMPQTLEHRIIFHPSGQTTPHWIQGARIPVQTKQPVVLAPPLRGGPWVAVYSPMWKRGHRRVFYNVGGKQYLPGRYAIDWVKVNSSGKKAQGDENKISNCYGYDADVLAVADGKIVDIRNDFPESTTLSNHINPPPTDAKGNFIVLYTGQDRYVFYEHIKPGSIRVKAGERVKRGQVIASLGYTGQTTGPHLHLHVANVNAALGAQGQPYVLINFKVVGFYKDMSKLGKAPWVPLKNSTKSHRTKERPASNAVVVFE